MVSGYHEPYIYGSTAAVLGIFIVQQSALSSVLFGLLYILYIFIWPRYIHVDGASGLCDGTKHYTE